MYDIDRLQKGINYIDENLRGKMDFKRLEQITLMSVSQFQKTFSGITGLSLNEYIRKRRLSNAALELVKSDRSILDTALAYGYETPEGFSRAFKDFHKINPMEVKKGNRNFSLLGKITLEIKVNGGTEMRFEFVELTDKAFAGIKTIADGNMNGDIDARLRNDKEVWESTRKQQNDIMTDDCIWYEIYKKADDHFYEHYICTDRAPLPDRCMSVSFDGGLYVKISTEKSKYPTMQLGGVYYSTLIDNQWLTDAGYELDDNRNQLYVTNWNMTDKEERYIEIYLPVLKI